ncbi:MAG: YabP/YqfC family sporulation protein [Oscillospiraceae bacterium]|nr:YabP/YqfC family sporulation protein [Oscillospiraceae bacterium]
MWRMERREQMLTRMAEMFDLPSDLVAGLCHAELLGDRQFFLEGHEGILSYAAEQIDISAGALIVRVRGQDLMLRSMTENEVRIQGKIESVEYVR